MTSQRISLNKFWQSAANKELTFQSSQAENLSGAARRYLEHALPDSLFTQSGVETSLASAVRLNMHGQIKLNGWHTFKAEQIIRWQQGMIWQATVWMNGLPVLGSDHLINGKGHMQWKLLGLLPVTNASGPDITRSAAGRMQGEYIWLPTAFLHRSVQWTELDDTHIRADLTFLNETTPLELRINSAGQLQSTCFKRWGNPDNSEAHYEKFGVYVDDEQTFSGYTIPTQIRAGWYFGSPRFESEGEFFRATIDKAIYQ